MLHHCLCGKKGGRSLMDAVKHQIHGLHVVEASTNLVDLDGHVSGHHLIVDLVGAER